VSVPERLARLRLLWVFARIGAQNEVAYRGNFWVQVLESLLSLTMALGTVALVFARTDTLRGWRPAELAAVVGVYFVLNGLIQMVIYPGLSRFIEDVRQGTLDFTLTKPEDAQLLVSITDVRVWKLLEVLLGAGVLVAASARVSADLGWREALGFALALGAGAAIVYSLLLALATTAFWYVRVENALWIFFSIFPAGRWPLPLYPGWLRATLAPIAFAVTVPASALVGRLDATALGGTLALAALSLAGSRWLFRRGLRRYSGASA
jgi:ABC-2 type transport system permease protein